VTEPHLTDEQVADQLAGVSLKATEAHLAECEACRDEIDRLRASLRSFNLASTAWSEAGMGSKHGSGHAARSWRPAAVWIFAYAVIIAAVLFFAIRRPVRVKESAVVNLPASFTSDTTKEFEQDNRLLDAIDGELDSADLSPEKMYGISSPGDTLYRRGKNRGR
jgi:hypothetical protein